MRIDYNRLAVCDLNRKRRICTKLTTRKNTIIQQLEATLQQIKQNRPIQTALRTILNFFIRLFSGLLRCFVWSFRCSNAASPRFDFFFKLSQENQTMTGEPKKKMKFIFGCCGCLNEDSYDPSCTPTETCSFESKQAYQEAHKFFLRSDVARYSTENLEKQDETKSNLKFSEVLRSQKCLSNSNTKTCQ